MSDKTIFMPDGGGCDASTMAAMLNNSSNQWNNPFMYLIWLALFRNGGGLFGGNGENNAQLASIQDTLNTQQTNGLVMDAIKGNASAINTIASQICCGINNMEKGFASVNYNLAEQSCQTRQSAKDNTAAVIAKLDAIEDSRKDREISALTAQLASATARAERQAEIAPIVAQLNSISAKQPSTATVPYPNLVGVPAAQYYGYQNNGLWS